MLDHRTPFLLAVVSLSFVLGVSGCSGASFTSASLGDGGGAGPDGSGGGGGSDGGSGADGSTSRDGGGVVIDGGAGGSDAGGATIDAGPLPGQAIECGPVKACARTETCCVYDNSSNFTYECRFNCPAPSGGGSLSQLKCASGFDCDVGHVCCAQRTGGVTSSFCAQSCTTTQGELCNPNSQAPQCPPGVQCSTNNISDWSLSTFYGTCGGIAAP